jgi:hypothetical protein
VVAASDNYTLRARVASVLSGTSFRILVDDVDLTGVIEVPRTGGWQNWQTVSRPGVPLTAGVHRLTLVSITGWFNLNWIDVLRSSGPAPYRVPGRIEAEDFDEDELVDSSPLNEGGVYRSTAVDIEVAADTGGGYNIGWIDSGERTAYPLDVAESGACSIKVRVASPVSGSAFRLLVDGIDVTGPLEVPDTAGWQNWQTVTRDGVTLTAGIHRLTFESLTGWFNLNWIEIQPAGR